MKITEKIESLFRREPLTAEELANRSETKSRRDAARQDEAVVKRTGRTKSRLL
jgi:DNA-binding protein H-NS